MAIPIYLWIYDDDGKLIHVSGNTYDRDMRTFRIHGDKRVGIAGFASEGCIIMSNATRLLVNKDKGALLEVVR